MPAKKPIPIGSIFERWTVIATAPPNRHGHTMLRCRCACGTERDIDNARLRSGIALSCGCRGRERARKAARTGIGPVVATHGLSRTREHRAWCAMKTRCNNANQPQWSDYGGRGIRYCEQWNRFENFLADMGRCPEGYTLDRIDVDGDYSKENCRWASRTEQNRNTHRNRFVIVHGRICTASEAALEVGLRLHTILARMDKLGWSPEKALTTPARQRRK